jgi:hypothetical protein
MRTLDDCVAAALGAMGQEVRTRFVLDPLATMRTDLGLKVTAAEHLAERRADAGACDGLSFLKDGVILYAPTDNSRRENFTLAHELGHWLVGKVPKIFDWLVEQPTPKQALETLCDLIAQRLLLADAAITSVVGDGPIRAQHVIDLYEATQASIPVCAIALAARLTGLCAIVVVDIDPNAFDDRAVVRYASVRPDPSEGWPKVYPWPGQAVPPGHPFQHLLSRAQTGFLLALESRELQKLSFWSTPWGERAPFYLDAVAPSRRRVIGILADTDLWGAERFHPAERRDYDQRPEREITCCGQTRKVRGYPHDPCGQIHCPACGKCRCDRRDDELVLCGGNCFLKYKPHLLIKGLCEDCR